MPSFSISSDNREENNDDGDRRGKKISLAKIWVSVKVDEEKKNRTDRVSEMN